MVGTEVPHDEGDLVRLCLDGDRSAFDQLVARHHRGIYNMLYRTLGDAEDAMDLTQEAFLRAYTRLDTFQQGRSFLAWLRRIAANLCIDHLRRRGQPVASLEEREEAGMEASDDRPSASPEDSVTMAEDSRRVLAALQQLPAKQRLVLTLRHLEGMSLEQIAHALRMPLGTVKVTLFRGRHTMRKLVGEL
mgnify:CR=1 FL=1